MKVNLDNEALEPRENVISNMLTCAELGWELDGLRQPMVFAGFPLLLVRAGVKLLLAPAGEGTFVGWQGIPSKTGWESSTDQPMAPLDCPGELVCFWLKADTHFQGIKSHNPDLTNFIPLPCRAAELERNNIGNFSNSETASHQIGILFSQSKIWEAKLTSKSWEFGFFL